MTVIAAVRDPAQGCVWIGSDTLAVAGGVKTYVPTKWAQGRRWAVGMAGQYRFSLLIARRADALHEAADVHELTDALRDLLEADGVESKAEKGEAKEFAFSALATDGQGLWDIPGDFGVGEHDHYAAAGSGEDFGWGAMHAAHGAGADPEHVARAGLMAAVELGHGCGFQPWKGLFLAEFRGERRG